MFSTENIRHQDTDWIPVVLEGVCMVASHFLLVRLEFCLGPLSTKSCHVDGVYTIMTGTGFHEGQTVYRNRLSPVMFTAGGSRPGLQAAGYMMWFTTAVVLVRGIRQYFED